MHTLEQLRSGALAGIRRLDLSADLTELPPDVFDLADTLEVLNLSGNRLSRLPPDLGRLHRLKIVFCSDNAFTHLPEVLGDCAALQVVGFKANRIAHVPPSALSPALRWLVLTDNAIAQLPAALGERPALQKLMLAGNQLSNLPPSLAGAQRLELVRLAANRLSDVPGWLTELPRLAWLALAGNPLGWSLPPLSPLATVPWGQLQLGALLGEGASGHIYRVERQHGATAEALALKLFKGAVTSDGLPEHERAACLAAGQHPALCTPSAELCDHPQGASGLLLPLIPPSRSNLAGPPSLDSCTRDVYPSGWRLDAHAAVHLAQTVAQAVAHLHRCGVLHGDLYAHNVLCNPANGDALLSDFGAATRLPADQPALSRALQALEVRALGCLLEELAAHALAGPGVDALARLGQLCQHPQPGQRPTVAEVCDDLQALL
ncbi:MAG: leucine-rich repeat-containing protein kinase family protein [Hydrogenophaga sp.]|uniref:leucine-rich repeat-containing protein kinase family protein n=1 Tax=Hydrogenophaga sp. TaxID=1904254 RepID=UPI002715A80C|nr:leucine-rich repeat-containing protein kinase family protein [Hydrogenophaga sp.]MDO9482125.1 leucine-rich repeat-containing protein kinase family protein [Hydrogenophaga sp.]MDP3346838.1 leucine-rich repeat-containing protein kinase family protein [Hydrogenophaga sp.]MDP3806780.1 leucine-rich repeat-containing protein kinase family protein [Hydrogenophaga sp.]